MWRNFLLLPLLSVLMIGSGASADTPFGAGSTSDMQEIARGKAIYVAQGCHLCHGHAGQGSMPTGPALVPLPLSDRGFAQYLRSPTGVMPSFSARSLPDADVTALLLYIRSLPSGPPASAIPDLAPYVAARSLVSAPTPRPLHAARHDIGAEGSSEGRQLYLANCAACHGAAREGIVGPNLQDEADKRTFEQTVQILKSPPSGMPRLWPKPLSSDDLRVLAAYLRTVRGD